MLRTLPRNAMRLSHSVASQHALRASRSVVLGRSPALLQLQLRRDFSASPGQKETASEKKDVKAVTPSIPTEISPASPNSTAPNANNSTPTPKPKTSVVKMLKSAFDGAYETIKDIVMNPRATWASIKEVAHHYWMGSKLLVSEVKVTREILGRVLRGHEMTRREHRQLIRTAMDMFRLVPFAVFVIIPFMEFLLPFALKLFPNMLPSTFMDSLKQEENLKKELQMRLAVAKFFQETMQEMANRKKNSTNTPSEEAQGATQLLDFVERARQGRPISNDRVIEMAKHFKDELTLPNIARPQLVSMCRYMGLQPYGADSLLRFQLRNKLRAIKEDDRRILWEGVDSLNTLELREACQERGMRALGLTQFKLKHQLQEWLELSTRKEIPISLLIMSRAFQLTSATDEPEAVLKSSMSALDADTINEIVVASASPSEEDSVEIRKRKLESIKFQQEMIAEEVLKVEEQKKKAAAAVANQQLLLQQQQQQHQLESPSTSAANTTSAPTHSADAKSSTATAAPSTAVLPATSSTTSSGGQPQQQKKVLELTVQEIQALADLARGGSLNREKSELQRLQATIEALLTSTKVSNGSAVVTTAQLQSATAAAPASTPATTTSSEIPALPPALPQAHASAVAAIAQGLTAPTTVKPASSNTSTADRTVKSTTTSASTSPADTISSVAATAAVSDALATLLLQQQADGNKEKQKKQLRDQKASDRDEHTVQRLQHVLDNMLQRLAQQIDTTEKQVGDVFNVLDKDQDGSLTATELRDAMVSLLRRNCTVEEAENLVKQLDNDQDGKISLTELLSYVEKRKETLEAELHAHETLDILDTSSTKAPPSSASAEDEEVLKKVAANGTKL